MKHQDIIGSQAVHQFAFVQSVDPALTPANEVAAGAGWLDTTFDIPPLRVRNAGNTGWFTIGIG